MLFQRELGVGEIFSESWDTFKSNMGLVFTFSFIFFLFRLANLGYNHLKLQRIVGDLDPSSTEFLIAQAKSQMAYVGLDLTYGIGILIISVIITAMLIMKFAQCYFDDERSGIELFGYAVPRAFKAYLTVLVLMGAVMIPLVIVLVIVMFAAHSIMTPTFMYIVMGIIGLLISPFAVAGSFIQYKILIDDAPFMEAVKDSLSMVFANIPRILGFIILISLLNAPLYGVILGFTKFIDGQILIRLVAEYATTFISVYSAVTFLVFYLDLDWRSNQESYTIIEEY